MCACVRATHAQVSGLHLCCYGARGWECLPGTLGTLRSDRLDRQPASTGRRKAWSPVFPVPVPRRSIPSPRGSWHWSPRFKSHSPSDPSVGLTFPIWEQGHRPDEVSAWDSRSFKPFSARALPGAGERVVATSAGRAPPPLPQLPREAPEAPEDSGKWVGREGRASLAADWGNGLGGGGGRLCVSGPDRTSLCVSVSECSRGYGVGMQ